jgi:hypothetical protein
LFKNLKKFVDFKNFLNEKFDLKNENFIIFDIKGNEVIFFDDLEEDTFKNGGIFIVALKKEKN